MRLPFTNVVCKTEEGRKTIRHHGIIQINYVYVYIYNIQYILHTIMFVCIKYNYYPAFFVDKNSISPPTRTRGTLRWLATNLGLKVHYVFATSATHHHPVIQTVLTENFQAVSVHINKNYRFSQSNIWLKIFF